MPAYQRGVVWLIVVTTASGARIRRSAGTSDKEAAQQLHDKLKHESWRTEQLGERPSKTWDEAALRWCQEMGHKRSFRNDAQHIEFLTIHIGGRPLAALTRDAIHGVVDSLLGHRKPATINRYFGTLHAILQKAVEAITRPMVGTEECPIAGIPNPGA